MEGRTTFEDIAVAMVEKGMPKEDALRATQEAQGLANAALLSVGVTFDMSLLHLDTKLAATIRHLALQVVIGRLTDIYEEIRKEMQALGAEEFSVGLEIERNQ